MSRLYIAMLVIACQAFGQAELPHFLRLPFENSGIQIQQGWHYQDGTLHRPKGAIDYINGTLDDSSTWQTFNVVAAADGVAIWDDDPATDPSGYGNMVIVRHNQTDSQGLNYFTLYAHLQDGSVPSGIPKLGRRNKSYGQWTPVKAGDFLGRTGSTGFVQCKDPTNCIHLHFEVNTNEYFSGQTDAYGVYLERSFYPGPCTTVLWRSCPPVIIPINQAPAAGFVMTSGIQSATQGQTLNLTVAPGGSANVTFDGSDPHSSDLDGTVVGWQWAINGVSASTSSSFSRTLTQGSTTYSQTVDDSGIIHLPTSSHVLIGTFATDNHSYDLQGGTVRLTLREISGFPNCNGSSGVPSLYVDITSDPDFSKGVDVAYTALPAPYGDSEYKTYTETLQNPAGGTVLNPLSTYYVWVHTQCSGGQADIKSDAAGQHFFGYITDNGVGTYSVNLVVTDNQGAPSQPATGTVVVAPAPVIPSGYLYYQPTFINIGGAGGGFLFTPSSDAAAGNLMVRLRNAAPVSGTFKIGIKTETSVFSTGFSDAGWLNTNCFLTVDASSLSSTFGSFSFDFSTLNCALASGLNYHLLIDNENSASSNVAFDTNGKLEAYGLFAVAQ